jgi:hypothetical protein
VAGLKGNVAWLLANKQASKGTPAAATAVGGAFKMPLTGGSIGPTRTTDNLSETDASRDRGNTYVQQTGTEGTPEFYVRDASIGFWLHKVLGADGVTGTTNSVHAITPSNTLPYVTPDSATPVAVDNGPVYNYNDVTGAVTLGGSVTALVRSFELTIENNLSVQQTDSSIPYDVVEGTREISLGFDLIFETLAEYNKFHYGGAAGTTQVPSVFTTDAAFVFTKGANNSVGFNLPVIAYEEFPVEPDAGGDPITVSVRAAAQRTTTILTATVKNQIATY